MPSSGVPGIFSIHIIRVINSFYTPFIVHSLCMPKPSKLTFLKSNLTLQTFAFSKFELVIHEYLYSKEKKIQLFCFCFLGYAISHTSIIHIKRFQTDLYIFTRWKCEISGNFTPFEMQRNAFGSALTEYLPGKQTSSYITHVSIKGTSLYNLLNAKAQSGRYRHINSSARKT